jgi:hypothetical protein
MAYHLTVSRFGRSVPSFRDRWRKILELYLKRLLRKGAFRLLRSWRFRYSDLKEAAPGHATTMGVVRSGNGRQGWVRVLFAPAEVSLRTRFVERAWLASEFEEVK